MRTRIFTLFVISIFCCTSCSKDDKVDLDEIIGVWSMQTDGINTEGPATYTFNADMTCSVYWADGGSAVTEGTYSVSANVLKIYDQAQIQLLNYKIIKLTGGEMKLRDTDSRTLTFRRQ